MAHIQPSSPESSRRMAKTSVNESARIDVLRQLSELNRQRYEEGVDTDLSASKTAGKGTRKTSANRTENSPSRKSSFEFEDTSANDGTYRMAAEQRVLCLTGSTHAIVEHQKNHADWYAKYDILSATGISDGQRNTAIADLIANGKVECQSEKHGARYRIVTEGAKG